MIFSSDAPSHCEGVCNNHSTRIYLTGSFLMDCMEVGHALSSLLCTFAFSFSSLCDVYKGSLILEALQAHYSYLTDALANDLWQ